MISCEFLFGFFSQNLCGGSEELASYKYFIHMDLNGICPWHCKTARELPAEAALKLQSCQYRTVS